MKKRVSAWTIIISAFMLILLTACSVSGKYDAALDKFPEADMSGYAGLEDCTEKSTFVDVSVKDVHELMENKESFVVLVSFSSCPWCNAIIKDFVEVANDEGRKIAYIDTRKNPSWKNNMEIDDYDLFVDDFGEYLTIDGDGREHLYVPHVFFVKDGTVVYEHQGAITAMGSDPNTVLTEEQHEELKDVYRKGFEKIR